MLEERLLGEFSKEYLKRNETKSYLSILSRKLYILEIRFELILWWEIGSLWRRVPVYV